jgi:hypothetical protein
MTKPIIPTKQQRDQQYFIKEQSTRLSDFNGKPVTTITMTGVNDRREYKTYIQRTNRNYERWASIIESPNAGIFVALDNLDFTTSKDGKDVLISADSSPYEIQIGDREHYATVLKDLWHNEEQAKLTGDPIFDRLFEVK